MNMSSITAIAASVALAFSAGAFAAQAISKDEYKAGQDKIAADFKSAKSACDSLKANARDSCMAEARGRQRVETAELEARKLPSDKTRHAVVVAKAEAEHAVAKEKPAAAPSKGESSGEYFDDTVITTKVKAAILKEPSLKSAEVNVETYKGVVQLSGFVSSRALIDKAIAVARKVGGVKSVKNNMVVKGKQ
jgi:osmotically-inducible protein OsmY